MSIEESDLNVKVLMNRLCLCGLMALGIVLIPAFVFKDFFFIDDAQNALLPFYREMGRIWLSGHLPLLTTNTYWGGNILVDMVHAPFCPQTILIALFSIVTDSFVLIADFLAWLNVTLVIFGGYWIGRILSIRQSYSFLLGFMIATNPVLIYIYCSSWWNCASGFAWFVVGVAALLQFRMDQSATSFFYAAFSLSCLMVSAFPNCLLAYAAFFLVVLGFDYRQNRNIIRMLVLCLIGLCAAMIAAIPVTAEYLAVKDLVERVSGFNNSGNFLVPAWGHVLNFFNPFFNTYINWFDGYRYIPLSLGYAGIIGLLPLFFYRHSYNYPLEIKIILASTFISLLFVFSSSQFGPLRWPFRYLPIAAVFAATLITYHIDKSKLYYSSTRLIYFVYFVGFFALIQLFSAEDLVFTPIHLFFVTFFIVLCLLIIVPFYKNKDVKIYPYKMLCFVTVLAWLGILLQTQTLADTYLLYSRISKDVRVAFTGNGYVLGLNQILGGIKMDAANLYSSQYLLFSAKSINGYSPVGHKGIHELIPFGDSAHGLLPPRETLRDISKPADGLAGLFNYQLLNISTIFADKHDITPEIAVALSNAGLRVEPYPVTGKVLIQPEKLNPAEGSLTYQSVDRSISLNHSDGMTSEWFDVYPANVERTVIFSRVYWPGYHAVLNATEYPVVAYKNALVKVKLPADASGKLHIYYEPVTWRYTKWSICLGLVLLVSCLIWLNRQDRGDSRLISP
ncbi:MAG: hypothetical protein PHG00_03545 [Methylococcales bacterium]|nr:hypothetical protein [Methylococcales bacterium]